jgi:hypothetical protein
MNDMPPNLPDIPRLYTALAEWCACMVYISAIHRHKGWKLWAVSGAALALQIIFLTMTGGLPIVFWIPCMTAAVGFMFLFIFAVCGISAADAGYYCIRSFVLAEFAASLEWQIFCYFWPLGEVPLLPKTMVLILSYSAVFLFLGWVERQYMPKDGRLGITKKGLWSAALIGAAVFALSNLSFVSVRTPFSGSYGMNIFIIRTMVDLGGVAILYAYHIQYREFRDRLELRLMQNILQNQYLQYQQSRESIEIINRKYHDLKHQIAILREEGDAAKRSAYLTEMENDIKSYEAQNKTGNAVLDTVLTGKSLYCVKHDITLTCVANGKLLDFMDVMDLCTIFGNALDNAIECTEEIEDKEKRLIHVSVFAQQGFLMVRFENYCEGDIRFEGDFPATTKTDTAYHGYGLKSIRHIVQKYGGTVTADVMKNWFELKILIPRNKLC